MTSIHWRRLAQGMAAAAIALTLAACSSSTSSSESTASAPATTVASAEATASAASSEVATAACVAAPTGTPLKIGVISSDTGGAGVQGKDDAPAVVDAWTKAITCQGGIGGHPVDVTYIDDKSDPAVSVQAAETLISDGVVAIMDNTALDGGWAAKASEAKVPVISLMASIASATYLSDPNFYPNQHIGPPTGIWAIAKAAELSGKKKLGVLYCSELPACAAMPQLLGPLSKEVGVELVYSAGFSASAPNFTALCLAARDAGVDSLAPIANPTQVRKVFADCAAQGYFPVAIAAGQGLGSDIESLADTIPVVYGTVGTVPWFVENDATQPFFDALDPYINSDGFKQSGSTPSGLLGDWVGLQMFAEAAKNVGESPTGADITEGLLAFKDNTVGGLTSPMTFAEGHLRGNCVFFYSIIDGVTGLPNGLDPLCRDSMDMPTG